MIISSENWAGYYPVVVNAIFGIGEFAGQSISLEEMYLPRRQVEHKYSKLKPLNKSIFSNMTHFKSLYDVSIKLDCYGKMIDMNLHCNEMIYEADIIK